MIPPKIKEKVKQLICIVGVNLSGIKDFYVLYFNIYIIDF